MKGGSKKKLAKGRDCIYIDNTLSRIGSGGIGENSKMTDVTDKLAAHRETNGNGLTLDQWLVKVDRIISARFGISVHDLADFCIWDAWNDGLSPVEGAEMALENDDLPWLETEEA